MVNQNGCGTMTDFNINMVVMGWKSMHLAYKKGSEAKWANPEKLKFLFMKPQHSKVGFRQSGHFSSA